MAHPDLAPPPRLLFVSVRHMPPCVHARLHHSVGVRAVPPFARSLLVSVCARTHARSCVRACVRVYAWCLPAAPTCMSKMDAACGHWKACLTTASTFEGIKQILEGFNAGRAKWLDKYEGNPYFPQYLWTEHSYKHCYGTSHSTTYTTEQDARNACLNLGSDCVGVYDQLCDKQGPFRTCLASGPIRSSYAGSWGGASCVRTRPGEARLGLFAQLPFFFCFFVSVDS